MRYILTFSIIILGCNTPGIIDEFPPSMPDYHLLNRPKRAKDQTYLTACIYSKQIVSDLRIKNIISPKIRTLQKIDFDTMRIPKHEIGEDRYLTVLGVDFNGKSNLPEFIEIEAKLKNGSQQSFTLQRLSSEHMFTTRTWELQESQLSRKKLIEVNCLNKKSLELHHVVIDPP